MQQSAPEAVDFSGESPETLALYGIDQPRTADFGRKCLIARRLVERGVRFIQIYSGGAHNDDNWDAHADLVANHSKHAGHTDKPIAGLIKDLKRRGLLDETLIVWGGEFGRQPTAEYAKGTGRDHNSYGFTMWMAGGGIKGGTSVGQTDELGQHRRRGPVPRQEPPCHDPEPARTRPQRPLLLLRRPAPEAGRRRRSRADQPDHLILDLRLPILDFRIISDVIPVQGLLDMSPITGSAVSYCSRVVSRLFQSKIQNTK